MRSSRHSMDFLFAIALFFVFASTSLIVLLLAANIYRHNVRQSSDAFEQNTSLAYITEKIHQNDADDTTIHLTTFDGYKALAISKTYHETGYTTYIYEMDGLLKEILIQDEVPANAQAGTSILKVSNLEMIELNHGLFRFTCESEDKTLDSVIVHVQSMTQ